MKFIASAFLVSAIIASVSAAPLRLSRRGVDPALVPDLGLQAGLNPTGTGDCDGIPNAQGVPIKIPCSCPPDRQTFIDALNANVAAGHAVNNPSVSVTFPTDDSKGSKLARITASVVTLQNLRGPGVGCPAVSTTLQAQAKAIEAGNNAPASAPAPAPASSPAPTPAPASGGLDPALVPDLGHASGLNPTGTGDCDGIPNAQGVPIKIPCACPPDRASFITALSANVAAGHAVNNPGVSVSFPTDNSKASKLARITASLITLQNLRGPGAGCPAVSTTLQAQAKAIEAGADAPAPAPAPAPVPAPAPAPVPASKGVDPTLVPDLGHQSGLNPTGTGDCDGIPNAQGVPIKVPCACPPDRATFIAALSKNVAAGHAVNNPGVSISFPTDNSKASKLARITASSVTLQNLRGSGVGCPIVSTTLQAQAKAIEAGP